MFLDMKMPAKTVKVAKIEVNTYKEEYKDDVQKITVETESQGIITKQKINYEIFPQTVEVKSKKDAINLYLGIEAQISPSVEVSPTIYIVTPKVLYKAGYNIQNKAMTVGIAFNPFKRT